MPCNGGQKSAEEQLYVMTSRLLCRGSHFKGEKNHSKDVGKKKKVYIWTLRLDMKKYLFRTTIFDGIFYEEMINRFSVNTCSKLSKHCKQIAKIKETFHTAKKYLSLAVDD